MLVPHIAPPQAPVVVSYGGGTNSTALLILMKRCGQVPALILFADTGDEKPHTYDHLTRMQDWCRDNGFPPITVVRNELPAAIKDKTLYGECLRKGTLPSKVFGYSSCSVKWKVEPQYRYLKRWMAENGVPFVEHYVGFDADEEHRANKAVPVRGFETARYPLIEADWGRDECVEAIDSEGLPRPGKSACFMCPSSRKPEVIWLKQHHPDLYARAIALESRAINGEGQAPAARVDGLGRRWNWATFAGSDIGAPEVDCGCYDGEGELEPSCGGEQLW